MRKLFERNMFWLVLVIFFIQFIGVLISYFESSNLNRTIGWGWDITNMIWWINLSFLLNLVFLIGYGVNYFLKRKTNFLLSIFHFSLIIFYLIFPVFILKFEILFATTSILIFSSNLIFSKKIELAASH